MMKMSIPIAEAIAAVALVADARADVVALHEAADHTTEATVTLDATPSEIYALVTDYAHWPAILGDVRWAKIERGDRARARVRFRSQILEHEVTVQFENQPDHAIRFEGVKGPPGGRARGSFVLRPVDGGKRTRVVASLYLDVVGVPSLFVSDGKLRRMREAKLRADMTDVARALEQRKAPPVSG